MKKTNIVKTEYLYFLSYIPIIKSLKVRLNGKLLTKKDYIIKDSILAIKERCFNNG